MINPVSIKCPECSAFLEIEEGRKQVYCTYCGAKLIMCNDNEYIVRHIDEAKVNRVEAENCMSYIKTKFLRFLCQPTIVSPDVSNRTFDLVPLQDFSHPWTDEMLYQKYGLTDEEVSFIESMIRPME